MTTLQKLKELEKYVSALPADEEPFVDLILQKLASRERHRLQRLLSNLMEQLSSFERQYGLDSNAFYPQYESGKMGDGMDYIEWASTIEMRGKLLSRLSS